MTIELWALFGATFTLFLSIFIQQIAIDRASGAKYAVSNRGELPGPPSAIVGRLTNLVRNHVEGLAVFGALVLIAHAAGVSNTITQYAALAILAARVLHFVFFSLGITPLRSLA
ncbi:MAG: MAPEG family protein [Pseudomonadota bacterium]